MSTDNFEKTRDSIKSFIGAKHSHEIIFTKGTTDAINLVANGFKKFLKKGDDIIISELEHHSNIVPWQICCEITGAKLKVIPLLENGSLNLKIFDELISKKTKLIAISHVSNTLGNIQIMLFRGPALAPPKGTLLEVFSHHIAIQGRPEAENVRFWGVWLQGPFLNRF